MNNLKTIAIFFLMPVISFAQDVIDSYDFFKVGLESSSSRIPASLLDISFPWIEQYEFRTETEDFNLNKQEYLFRVSPSNPAKRKAQKEIFDWIKNTPDFKLIEENCENWKKTHEDWLNLYLIEAEIRRIEDLSLVLQDRQRIYEKMIGSYDFELQKLVKLQADKNDLALRLYTLNTDKEIILRQYGFSVFNLSFTDFPSIKSLNDRMITMTLSSQQVWGEEAKYEKSLITKELQLEKAEEKQLIDFAQLRYQGPHSDVLSEKLALGLGLRLNTSGNRKLKIQELLIKQDNIDRKIERESIQKLKDLNELKLKLQKLLEAYDYFENLIGIELNQLGQLGDKLVNEEKFSPLILLDIEERKIKNGLDKIKLQKEIFEGYLELLDLSGILCRQTLESHWK